MRSLPDYRILVFPLPDPLIGVLRELLRDAVRKGDVPTARTLTAVAIRELGKRSPERRPS